MAKQPTIHLPAMRQPFHIYTSTIDCKELFPQNFNGEHNVQLAEPIHLEGKWSCGLVEFQLSNTPNEPVYVCCNLVRESTSGPFNIPILREISQKTTEFKQVLYIPLKQHQFHTIQIFIRTLRNEPLPLARGVNEGSSFCTLHFRRDDA